MTKNIIPKKGDTMSSGEDSKVIPSEITSEESNNPTELYSSSEDSSDIENELPFIFNPPSSTPEVEVDDDEECVVHDSIENIWKLEEESAAKYFSNIDDNQFPPDVDIDDLCSAVNSPNTFATSNIPQQPSVLPSHLDSIINTLINNGYMAMATSDTIIEDVTKEYLNYAIPSDISERTISKELLIVTNTLLDTLGIKKKLSQLCPSQIGMILIRKHIARKISLDGSDNENENSTILAIYVDEGVHKGLYKFDPDNIDIRKIIKLYSYTISKSKQDEVLQHLKIFAPLLKTNNNPDLIAVNNGIFDYKKKELIPFSPDLVFTSKVPYDYNVNAFNVRIYNDTDGTDWDIESWMKSLSDDPEVVALLWQVVSASIRINLPFGKVPLLYSRKGNNGKGTLCELIRNLVGRENCCSISIEDFDKGFMLSPILNAAIVIGDENPVGISLDRCNNFKACITQDPITINIKFQTPRLFRFRGLIIQCINEVPRFKDKTGSMARRLLIVPFEKCFIGAERKYIKNDYIRRTEVLEYVLYKALNMDFYEFSEPQACIDALDFQREMNDPIRQYWEDLNGLFKWDVIPTAFLYDLYKSWMMKNIPHGHQLGSRNFMQNLVDIATTESGEWEYEPKKQYYVTDIMRKTPEPLIAEFDLSDWKNPIYTGKDISKIYTPQFKDKYTGLKHR